MIWLIVVCYFAGSALAFWAMCESFLREFGTVTLNDAVFFGFMAITPAWVALLPVALCTARKEIILWERK